MLQLGSPGESTIGRLRIIANGIDPLVAQLRLASLLSGAQLHPAGVPPAAVIFIRKLRDPLPYSLRIQQRDIRPPPNWQEAFTAMLDRLVATAARPARGSVPTSAEAVVFLDRSELLASLASDWCEGSLMTRWWWQSLLRQGAASQIVRELWQRTPEYVPAALEQLAKANKAGRFVNCLSDAEALSLLAAVARSFSLHALLPVVDAFSNHDSPSTLVKEESERPSPALRKHPATRLSLASRRAPWDRWVRESALNGLGPEQRIFLGVGLMLQRAPDRIRAASFAHEVATWRELSFVGGKTFKQHERGEGTAPSVRQESAHPQAGYPETGDKLIASLNDDQEGSRLLEQLREPAAGAGPTGAPHETPVSPPDLSRAFFLNGRAPGAKPEPRPPALVSSSTDDGLVDELAFSGVREKPATSLTDNEVLGDGWEEPWIMTAADASQFDQTGLIEAQAETGFGGVFYLINLALYLGLYGDFTTPAEPGLALNIWDFVSLVARKLIGERLEGDPLWTLLARLAARSDDDQPGSSFEPEDDWRLPAEWLQPFPNEATLQSSTGEGRLRLLHSSGFLVLDVPLETGNPVEQLERELKAYKSFGFRVSSFELSKESVLENELETRNSKLETPPAVAAWLNRLLPYLRSRLCLALGLKETENPATLLCQHNALVCVTGTHLDVFLSLVDLPTEIRFAGLDRDPGWVPAAGRFIAFHFD